jgi:hemoglobin-like flavoprotein
MLSGPGGGPRELAEHDADQALAVIRDTYARVAAAGDDAAAYFYGWLFMTNPELRDLFPPAMDTQRDRLFAALTRIVNGLAAPNEMAGYLAQLGVDHRKYGVQPRMYLPVGNALIATLRAFAGSAFTQFVERAWMNAYEAAALYMINAAEQDSASAPALWTAEVVAHDKRGARIAVLTVEPDQPLSYQAGQHVTVQTERWPRVWRPYSIACRPRDDGLLRFHVKAVPGGWVSGALVDHTKVGDRITLGPAVGEMVRESAARRDLICIAGGTGLAPLKAIVEEVASAEAGRQAAGTSCCSAARAPRLSSTTSKTSGSSRRPTRGSACIRWHRPTEATAACRATSARSRPGTCRTPSARPSWPARRRWCDRRSTCSPRPASRWNAFTSTRRCS